MAQTLFVRDGDNYREASAQDILDRASSLVAQRFRAGAAVIDSPARTREFLQHQIGGLQYEVFGALLLDNRHRLIRCKILFRGTIDGASVYPREVVREVLDANAAALVLFHNHPSGTCTPSQADEIVTRRLRDAMELINVRILDHIIVGDGFYSFAESGLL